MSIDGFISLLVCAQTPTGSKQLSIALKQKKHIEEKQKKTKKAG